MSDLGPRLLREGLISREDLALALQAQAREGRTVAYHLLSIGAIAEDMLVRYFAGRFPIDEARPSHVREISSEVLGIVPSEMIAQLRVLPLTREGDALSLAMADPSDLHALQEVRFYTGDRIVPWLIRESLLAAVLEAHFGVTDDAAISAMRIGSVPPPPPLGERPSSTSSAWGRWDSGEVPKAVVAAAVAAEEGVVLLTQPRPSQLPEPLVTAEGTAERAAADPSAVVPLITRAPFRDGHAAMPPPPAEEPRTPPPPARAPEPTAPTAEALDAILAAPDRDHAIGCALDALHARAGRAVFFAMKRGRAEGWDARGGTLTRDQVRALWVPLSAPSLLKDVVAAGAPYFGPPGDALSNGVLLAALGARPDRVLLCPVLVRGTAVGTLYADALPPDATSAASTAYVEAVATTLATAVERLILKQKG